MQSIQQIFEQKTLPKRKPNSQKAEIIEQLCQFMDGNNSRFGYWIGRTRHLSPSALYDLIRESKEGKNPAALFEFKLKQIKK